MKTKVYILNSFAETTEGGNPAGVVLNADHLTEVQMKAISKEVGFSETAFVMKSDKVDYKVRFFTPTDEVDLCGHATVATYSLLLQKELLNPGNITQELKAGDLEVQIDESGLVMMQQTLPVFSEEIKKADIQAIFGEEFLFETLKPQVVSTGLRDILLPVLDRKMLFSLKPNFKKMSKLNEQTNSVGVHAFTLDTLDDEAIAHCRNFAPLYGIDEESATGSSNGALACYLFKNRQLKHNSFENMKFEQGYSMQKPSEIFVTLKFEEKEIVKIFVGGNAIMIKEREIEV